MTASTTTTLAKVVGTYIEEGFYGSGQPDFVLINDAVKYEQPRGAGNKARMPRMRPMARRSKTNESGTGSTAEGSNPTAVALTVDSIELTMSKLDNLVEVTRESWLGAIKSTSQMVSKTIRNNYDQSFEYNLQTVLSKRFNACRIDNNGAEQLGGTADAGSSTAALVDDGLTAYFPNNTDLVGALVIIVAGVGAGQVRTIATYTASSGTCTVTTAFDVAPTTGSTYKIVTTRGLSAATPFGTYAFYIGRRSLHGYKAPKYGAAVKYHVAIDGAMEANLLQDEVFRKTGMYRDPKKTDEGIIGNWLGCDVGVTTEDWTEAEGVIGTYVANGPIHTAFFYGKETFGCVAPKTGGEGIGNVEFINLMGPDKADPTNAYTSHGYVAYYAAGVPFGLWGCGVKCGSEFTIQGDSYVG